MIIMYLPQHVPAVQQEKLFLVQYYNKTEFIILIKAHLLFVHVLYIEEREIMLIITKTSFSKALRLLVN